MKKIRILHFIYKLEGGGAERQLRILSNYMDSGIFKNAICCGDASGSENLVPETEIFEIPKSHKLDMRWPSVARLMKSWKPDIVHCWPPVVLLSCAPIARLTGVRPFIASYRSVYRIDGLRRFLQAIGFLMADVIVSNVHEKTMKQPFKALFKHNTSYYIPNSVDIASIQSAVPSPVPCTGSHCHQPVFLYAGRLVKEKNLSCVLQAMALLAARKKRVCLLICGEGPEKNRLMHEVRSLNIQNRVSFAGYREDLYSIMKNCSGLVLSSFREGMPNVVFEALGAGLPAIVSDIPVHRHWLTHKKEALLFNPDNPDNLADEMNTVLTEPFSDRQCRIYQGQKLAEKLSIEQMTWRYESLYLGLLKQNS